jgi:hypothetical protein
LSETKVTDIGSKRDAATTAPSNAEVATGDVADAEATAPPLASPAAKSPAATRPAPTNLDLDLNLDHHVLFVLITTRIRRNYQPIADPEWPDLPNRARSASGTGAPNEPSGGVLTEIAATRTAWWSFGRKNRIKVHRAARGRRKVRRAARD